MDRRHAVIALAALLLASAGPSFAKDEKTADYIGRWYLDFPEVCDGAPNETDGMLTYTPQKFIGIENECRLIARKPRGKATVLVMKCVSDGGRYRTTEIVQVVDGKLHRTLKDAGKWVTYTYERCQPPKR